MTANELHQKALVLDSHCDTPLMLLQGNKIGQRIREGHQDFVRMREGGIDASFFAVYVSNRWDPDTCTYKALELFARIYDTLEENADVCGLALTPADAVRLKAEGKIALFIGMENGGPIHKDLSLLRLFWKMGARYITLTHSGNNEICDSCSTQEKRWGGLSPFGREVVAEMNRLGMLVDVSHISDEAFWDVVKYATKPMVATHSCCRALCDVPRNMTDDMIRALGAAGGVIQVNFYPAFLDKDYAVAFGPLSDAYDDAEALWKTDHEKYQALFDKAKREAYALPRPSFKRVVDHIDHAVALVGAQHVGLGSDFDGIAIGPDGLEDASCMPRITEELWARGYQSDQIEGILGRNFLRVMEVNQRS